jgi:hypothetical protein
MLEALPRFKHLNEEEARKTRDAIPLATEDAILAYMKEQGWLAEATAVEAPIITGLRRGALDEANLRRPERPLDPAGVDAFEISCRFVQWGSSASFGRHNSVL